MHPMTPLIKPYCIWFIHIELMILVGIFKVQIMSQNECVILHRAAIKWVRERDVLYRN